MSGRDRVALRAVVFDLDGVLTDTAAVHAAAWKQVFDDFLRDRAEGGPFEPFDVEAEYRRYVDGRPRYDGVSTFLASRNIVLPWGSPIDGPEADTVCGVGNRKNDIFLARLDADGVAVFPDALRMLDRLDAAAVRIGLHTSSRNGRHVLEAAGLLDRLDVVVDGSDLVDLHIPGKPDPAPFREAVHRLGVSPIDAAIVEDAAAGVRSGRRGGFGLVVGVARDDADRSSLRRDGADLVVGDLDELTGSPDDWRALGAPPPVALADLPDATAELVLDRLAGQIPFVCCDFDGTLSEIVRDPDAATIVTGGREALVRLTHLCPVALVSGRGADDVAARVPVAGLHVAGAHGFEVLYPDGERRELERGASWVPALAAARDEVREELAPVPGVLVEDKHFAIAVHYRNVERAEHDRVHDVVAAAAGRHRLALSGGKMVVELRPPVPWDKGAAVVALLDRIAPDAVPVYIGDDVTDEDAFRVLRGWGISIAVRGGDHPTAADAAVDDPRGVVHLLDRLAAGLERATTRLAR